MRELKLNVPKFHVKNVNKCQKKFAELNSYIGQIVSVFGLTGLRHIRRLIALNREKNLEDLRKQSRRQYLSKRKEDKLLELKDDINDDEFLFDESQLTERERRERKYKKRVLELATAHTKAGESEKEIRYKMPEDRKKGKNQGRVLIYTTLQFNP